MPALEYIFSIKDQASDKLLRITAASQPLISAVTTVQEKMASAETLMNEAGGSITALKAQIDALTAERDLLPAEGLETIAQYNERIGELLQRVADLQAGKPKPVTVPYTFTLNDRVSGGLRQINKESEYVKSAMDGVGQKIKAADALMDATGRSVGALRMKIEALRAEREWIPSDNINAIREYDSEIKSLADEIERVENLTSGQGNLAKWANDISGSIPGIGLLKNPIVQAGAAIVGTAKSAMTFDQNMAQVNITTLLEGEELDNLRQRIREVADEFGADASSAPLGFDLINSQLNDIDKSMNVLQASIKGSKAGFTDMNTVASALAQTVSLLGDVDANEVLDVFFASKRMGAVDFSSLAHYLPKLLSLGNGMGIDYKEVAGTFSYLTGKGQSAEQATVMLSNAMSMLGKGDVRDKMVKAGVKVFDEQGKVRGMTDIFGDLGNLMNGRSDEERSQILEAFGIVDKEAKGAFNVLISDMEKYKNIIDGVQDATKNEEGNKALAASKNTVQEAEEAWNRFKNVGLTIGEKMLPVISTGLETFSTIVEGLSPVVQIVAPVISGALSVVGLVLEGITFTIRILSDLFGGWLNYIADGSPLVWGLTAALGALGVVWAANTAIAKTDIIWQGIKNAYTIVSTTLTEGWAAAQALLNASFLACPITWLLAGIVGVIAAVAAAWQKFEGFRVAVFGAWSVIKEFSKTLISAIISPLKQVLKGIGSIGEAIANLFKGNFDKAADAAKQGFKDIGKGMLQASPAGYAVNTWKNGNYKEAWEKGSKAGHESWTKSQAEKGSSSAAMPKEVEAAMRTMDTGNISAGSGDLLSNIGKGGKTGKTGKSTNTAKILNLNEDATNYSQSADYVAATAKLSPVTARLLPIGDVTQTANTNININAAISKTQVASSSGNAMKVDTPQEYEPESINYLSDIMANVRKIAAALMLPMVVSLSSPASANTDILSLSNVKTYPEATSVSASTQEQGKVNHTAIDLSRSYETTLPEIIIMPGSTTFGESLTGAMTQAETVNTASDLPQLAIDSLYPSLAAANTTNTLALSSIAGQSASLRDATEIASAEDGQSLVSNNVQHTMNGGARSITIDRVCDQIVINVENTDGQGADEIRSQILEVLNEIVEG